MFEDAFAHDLRFGTGGLRGKVGIGPNRLNVWTVGKATQGLADYLKANFVEPSVVIARDSRRGGEDFSWRAAEVLAANDIVVHILGLASTPELSFAVRDLGCSAGVCVTASHNPAEYNGYKVYGLDGCQITTEAARQIQASIDAADTFEGVSRLAYEDAVSRGVVQVADAGTRGRYFDAVRDQLVGIDCSGLKVAYTPLNGTGGFYAPGLLRGMGVDVLVVPEQKGPDGEFPTCPKPNPEVPAAMELVTTLAQERGCDLALATDPDADRVGVVVPHEGSWRLLSGNEVGELLFDWLLARAASRGEDLSRFVCATTVVSAPRADDIARVWGVQLRRTLTGFKFIGEQIGLLDAAGEADRFLFGLEESCGYLKGSYVRDKDGVEALALVCEMAADYRARGMDLVEALEDLARRVGFQAGKQLTIPFEGADGSERMTWLMASLRAEAPETVAGQRVESIVDYSNGAPMPVVNPLPYDPEQTLSPTDMLEWRLEGGSRVLVRPSGTEPKLKAYCFAKGASEGGAEAAVASLSGGTRDILAIRAEL
ncbi:phospho-sugar mutase [Thermophilibacter sp.]